jgi:glycerol-3-phosphate O-acyltransferase / dihydroxyacetone phosphate acyltransferase
MIFKPKVRIKFQFSSRCSFVYQDHPNLLAPIDFADIRSLTGQLHDEISSGTFNSPSWDFIRTAKLAARMYAPLGTSMKLGDHIRLIRTFLEAFKAACEGENKDEDAGVVLKLHSDLKVLYFHQCRYSCLASRLRRPIKTNLHSGVSKTIG